MKTITIISASTNSRNVLNSNATTLAELKAEMRAAGVNFDNMSFFEGISKTELVSDESQLPTQVMYKGEPTDNLVILLTLQNKKIKSGALSEARSAVLKAINDHNLNSVVIARFGRNCTQVSTDDLLAIIDQAVLDAQPEVAPAAPAGEPKQPTEEALLAKVREAAQFVLDFLNGIEQVESIDEEEPAKPASPYTDDELADIVDSL